MFSFDQDPVVIAVAVRTFLSGYVYGRQGCYLLGAGVAHKIATSAGVEPALEKSEPDQRHNNADSGTDYQNF